MFLSMSRKLQKLIFKSVVLTILGFGFNQIISSNAFAQTRETYHQVSDPKNGGLHSHGKEADMSKGFFDRYAAPKDISTTGHRMMWLFQYTSWVTFFFFLLMAGALVGFIFIYRDRPGRVAYYTHGHSTHMEAVVPKILDIAVFVSLDLVLIGASFLHTGGSFGIPYTQMKYSIDNPIWDFPKGPDVVNVQIMPQQWVWNFRYAGNDGTFGTEDDITTINQLVVPKGRKVMAQIKSKDVIHGFWMTNVRIQMDAIPGMVTRFWFDTTQTGEYEITCAHHCGTNHYKMKAFLKVIEDQDFIAWTKENSDWAQAAFDANDPSTKWGWNWSLYQ